METIERVSCLSTNNVCVYVYVYVYVYVCMYVYSINHTVASLLTMQKGM